MGGKTKQSQRTKNNVRPSSSSRSAELLNNGVGLDGGLVTLGSGKPLPQLFPTLAAANLDQGLNPEFQMCIKKLNKKDPITRAKALQELCELINNSDVEDVVAALPSWAHFYKILTADTDRKVREMTQVCHGALVRVCGRRAAPRLKALLPAWLTAQHDQHAPAQAHARRSLTSTFPDSKLPDVISFCKVEVIAHLIDNLIGNAEAVISKRIESAEECELQMNRIITSSLQGLEYFTVHLPPAHDAWLWTELTPLLQANAFWKFAHNTHQVRAAWYGAMGRIIERYKGTFGAQFGLKSMRILLDAAREQNALVAAQLWTCLLQLMHNVQDWQTYVDKKELLIKRILDVLENGGWGDARHLSNMLLPLLAYLPKDLLTKDFYEAFFNAVFAGLDKKNILNSKSERQSWITSLAECLRYLSIQQDDFVLEIASSVHRTWLAKVLSTQHDGQTKTNLIKCSATNMTTLVKYWLKQSKEENSEKYDQLVRNFWQNVGSTVVTQIDKSSTDQKEIGKLIEGHILFLQTLKTSFTQETKKQQSIKFDGDEQTTPEKCAVVTQQCDASIVERYQHNLEDLVHKICSHYFESAEKKQVSSAILTPLITLLVEFDSKNLFMALARQFEVDSVYRFYEKVLKIWLAGDTMRCKAVADIVFILMKYMSEEEQDSMFDTFQQFPAPVVEWCLAQCVAQCVAPAQAARGAAARWLRGAPAAAALGALAARAARADAAAARLLALCLRAPARPGAPAVAHVLRVLGAALRGGAAPEASGALAARLARTLQDHAASPHYAQLVQGLFRLNILVPRGDSRLSVDTWCEIRSSWQDGVAALPEDARKEFLHKAAEFLHEQLFENMEDLNMTKIENIVSPCPHLFSRRDDAEGPDDITEIVAFTQQIFDMKDPESHVVESYALRHECVTSQLNCLYDDDNDVIATVVRDSSNNNVKELTKTDLMAYVNKFLFRAIYLKSLLLHKICLEEDEEEPSPTEQKTWCDVLLKDKYLEKEFCKVLYNYVVINSLHEGYAFWPHYDIIEQTKRKLDSLLSDVIASTSVELRSSISTCLSQLGAASGYLWAYAQRWYSLQVGDASQQDRVLDGLKLEDIVSGNGFFHTLQASTKWSSDEDAAYTIKYLVMLRSWYTAYGDTADEDLVRDVTRCREQCDIDVIVNAYYKHNHTMLYEKDISDTPWSAVVSNVAVVEFLTALVSSRGWEAPAHHWDFTTITLCSLLSTVEKSKDNWGSTKVSMLARAVLRLFGAVRAFVLSVRATCERRAPAAHVAALPQEWADMFAPDTHYNLFSVVMHVLDSCTESEMTGTRTEVLGELISCTKLLAWAPPPPDRAGALGAGALGAGALGAGALGAGALGAGALGAGALGAGALGLGRAARGAAAALQQPAHRAHKYLAYYLLLTISKPLVLDDAEKLSLWSEDSLGDGEEEKERPQFALDYFHDAFTHLHDIVDAALSNVVVGEETCEIVAMSDSYSMALGWLLLADVLAVLCQLARGDLTHHYIQIYRQRQYAEPLLTAALRLLPRGVLAWAHAGSAPAPPRYADMFCAVADYNVREPARGSDIGALACRCVYSTLCGAGCGAARGWWGAAPARAARLLQRAACAYVAPRAARDQLRALRARAHELPDTEVRIAWSSNEVTCIYNVEERFIELRVWLARDHPLVAPRLAAPDAAGPGANTHWVALYLAYQNGTLLNALKMWTQAVSAKVESSPQCYICYCRLHPSTGRLPRVPCHQCKNKFHNMCLRKWFATSNKSNCPLCRSKF